MFDLCQNVGYNKINNRGIMKRKLLFLLACMFVPFLMVGCKKEQPALTVPQNLSVDNGIIIFNAVDGAQYYTITIGDLTFDVYTSNENVKVENGIVKYDANKILSVTENYSVKVKACSKERTSSEFSSNVEYKHVKKLEAPTNVKTNQTTLTWDVVELAKCYRVKVVTPKDTVLFDEDGNALPNDDLENIELAKLSEYKLNVNSFDFASIIKDPGKYSFFVRAEYEDETYYSNSDFVRAGSYEHFVKLDTPKNLTINKINDELHLLAVVDAGANQLKVECGEFVAVADLSSKIVTKQSNCVDVNLTQLFKNVSVNNSTLDLNKAGLFEFKTLAQKQGGDNYYLDSSKSDKITFVNQIRLQSPTNLKLEYNALNSAYVATWHIDQEQTENISSYKLMVATSSGVDTYVVNNTISTCQIGNDVIGAAVIAQGVGNYTDSKLSTFVSNNNNTQNVPNFSMSRTGDSVVWNALADYYVVETDSGSFVTTETSFNINDENAETNSLNIKVVAIKNGYEVATRTLALTHSVQLETPSFDTTGSMIEGYKINVIPTEYAMGYYVYLASGSSSNFVKIDKLFTETSIDLREYISTEGAHTLYRVKVQAVANIYGKYTDSELSSAVTLEGSNQLSAPEFYKVNGKVAPVIKEGDKYYLQFYGVKNATGYQVLVNYNLKSYGVISANYEGIYKIEITNYLDAADDYLIMVKATVSSSSDYVSSEYTSYTYKLSQQLAEVTNIKINEHLGEYTVVFDEVENATHYKIRVVKVNDFYYDDFLIQHGLQNPYTSEGFANMTKYFEQSGTYYVYVTAVNLVNENYKNSIESSTFGQIVIPAE